MTYAAPLETHPVKIRQVVLGAGERAVRIGGEDTFPFHFFEGSLPNSPGLALEVLDMSPENWAPWVTEPFQGVLDRPAEWARKCFEEYGAEIVFETTSCFV